MLVVSDILKRHRTLQSACDENHPERQWQTKWQYFMISQLTQFIPREIWIA